MSYCWSTHIFIVLWTYSAIANGCLRLFLGSVAIDIRDVTGPQGVNSMTIMTGVDPVSINSSIPEVIIKEIFFAHAFNEKMYKINFLNRIDEFWTLLSLLGPFYYYWLGYTKFRLCIICPWTPTRKPYVDNQCTKKLLPNAFLNVSH